LHKIHSIFITSANGYLGSSLADFLSKKKNLKVYYGNRSRKSNRKNEISNWQEDIRKIFKVEIDTIIYSTGLNRDTAKDKSLIDKIHISDLKKMIELGYKNNIKRFIYLSSIHVFKSSSKYYDNRSLPNNDNDYAKMHQSSEKIIKFYQKKFQNISIIRVSNCFGYSKNMSQFSKNLFLNSLIFHYTKEKTFKLKSNKKNIINSCPLIVFNELIYKVSIKNSLEEIYNLGIGKSLIIEDIIKLVEQRLNKKFKINNFKIFSNENNTSLQSLNIKFNLKKRFLIKDFNFEIDNLYKFYK